MLGWAPSENGVLFAHVHLVYHHHVAEHCRAPQTGQTKIGLTGLSAPRALDSSPSAHRKASGGRDGAATLAILTGTFF